VSTFSQARITKVHVQGFRSLENVLVNLEPLTVLVGPNSSGKSSFLDALAFLQESLSNSPDEAFGDRGGISQVLTRTGYRHRTLSIEVDIQSRAPGEFSGNYYVRVRKIGENDYLILEESCHLTMYDGSWSFTARRGKVTTSISGLVLNLTKKALALPILGRSAPFNLVFAALTAMSFHRHSSPAGLASTKLDLERSHPLATSISNTSDSVLKLLRTEDKVLYQTVVDALCRIIPSIRSITPRIQQNRASVSFQEVYKDTAQEERSVIFDASSMSAGTIHILNILLTLYPLDAPTLVALEEPETAIHPGAAAVLVDAMKEASRRFQILITTHSPDLITRFETSAIRAVERVNGVTIIAPIVDTQRDAIRDGLFTAGELHQIEGLRPDREVLHEVSGSA
jgi:predicted ATPase